MEIIKEFYDENPVVAISAAVFAGATLMFLMNPSKKEDKETETHSTVESITKNSKGRSIETAARKLDIDKTKSQGAYDAKTSSPVALDTALGTGKKKKKKRSKAAKKKSAASSPVDPVSTQLSAGQPVVEKKAQVSFANDDDSDDESDALRLLSGKQLAKAGVKTASQGAEGGKKKKKKKKKAEVGSTTKEELSEWESVSAPVKATPEDSKDDGPPSITLNIHPDDPPMLIGTKGSTISQIESTSGARLDITKNSTAPTVRITGTETEISLALEQVQGLLAEAEAERAEKLAAKAHSVNLNAADINGSDGVKAIIGRGGATIQSIQSDTGTTIDASVELGTVVITGPTQEAVTKAATLCRHAVFGECQDVLELGSRSMVMAVYGPGYAKIRDMQDESGAKLDIERGGTTMKLSGSRADVEKARALVTEWMELNRGVTMETESSKIGAVYGKAGANIRSIQERTGTYVDVDQSPAASGKILIRIVGEAEAVEEARSLFQKSIDGEIELQPGEVLEIVDLGQTGAPAVIGTRGSKITELERTHGAKITVSTEVGQCRIVGSRTGVDSAKAAVEEIVKPLIEAEKLKEQADLLAESGDSAWQAPPENENKGWAVADEDGW